MIYCEFNSKTILPFSNEAREKINFDVYRNGPGHGGVKESRAATGSILSTIGR